MNRRLCTLAPLPPRCGGPPTAIAGASDVRLGLQAPTGPDPVQVAVDVELPKVSRRIGAPGLFRPNPIEA